MNCTLNFTKENIIHNLPVPPLQYNKLIILLISLFYSIFGDSGADTVLDILVGLLLTLFIFPAIFIGSAGGTVKSH